MKLALFFAGAAVGALSALLVCGRFSVTACSAERGIAIIRLDRLTGHLVILGQTASDYYDLPGVFPPEK